MFSRFRCISTYSGFNSINMCRGRVPRPHDPPCPTRRTYWALRKYLPNEAVAVAKEIGREPTVNQYIGALVSIFREVSRVLMNDGTLWLNLGDTYAKTSRRAPRLAGVKPGELIGVPWKVALALQADGWYLRSDVIWHKRNPKPESVKNRPTKAHEYLFLFSKRERNHYDVDALREPCTSTGGASFGKQRISSEGTGAQSRRLESAAGRNHPLGKNKRSVWKIPVRAFRVAHFAVLRRVMRSSALAALCRLLAYAELDRASLRFIRSLDERCLHNPLTSTTALDGDCGKWRFHKCWANCSLTSTRNQQFP